MTTAFAPAAFTAAATTAPAAQSTHSATSPQAQPAGAAPRFDMYAAIHKALRSFMMDTLFRVGRLDVQDADDTGRTLAQLDELLTFCTGHIAHENDHVHAAIDARRPAGAARTSGDHVEHLETIAALRCDVVALQTARPDDKPMLALRLYRHMSLFVADNFQHMHYEETANNAALWALYTDAELVQIHERILASITPQEHLLVARWMVPALSPLERAMVLGDMKQQTPPEALLGVLAHVRPHLDDTAWGKLARAIGVPQVPGLIHFS